MEFQNFIIFAGKTKLKIMKPQEWYNNNLSDTKQSLNKVNKTILYISIIRL